MRMNAHASRSRKQLLLAAAVGFMVCGCAPTDNAEPDSADTADAIYIGDIVTVNDAQPTAEAVAVKQGVILAVGSAKEVMTHRGSSTELVELGSNTLLPGFIDAHGHLKNVGFQALAADLLPPPDSDVDTIERLQEKLRAWGEGEISQRLGWIIGFGYDDSQLAEGRHPTRDDLDSVSTDRPIFIIHQSGHLYSANSKLLEMAGITAETEDPPGGVIRRRAGTREPDGVLEETAAGPVLKVLPAVGEDGARRMVREGIAAYTRFGFTTATEGRAFPADLDIYAAMADAGELGIDVVAFPDYWLGRGSLENNPWVSRDYRGRFRIGGVKGNLDGSPQGKTAWMTEPYFVPPEGRDADYAGYPMLEEEQALAIFDDAYARGWQVINHVNGDAAIDQMIRAARAATEKYGPADRRTVGIHSQTIRPDQLDAYAELGIIPSFFGMHTFYWGDWHRESVLGPERAAFISPAKAALDRGLRYTEHHDAPVALPSSIMIIATQVNRTTRSGQVLGPDQRVSPMDAIRSTTINAAYQYFEEDRKGSIEPGKLADLVILDANPLEVPPEALFDLEVVETIKEGRTVFRRGE